MTQEGDGSELLPCPFCGAKMGSGAGPLQFNTQEEGPKPWHVYCWSCTSQGPSGLDEATVTAAWNTRAPTSNDVEGGDQRSALEYVGQVFTMLVSEAERGPSGHGKLICLGSDQWRTIEHAQAKVAKALGVSTAGPESLGVSQDDPKPPANNGRAR